MPSDADLHSKLFKDSSMWRRSIELLSYFLLISINLLHGGHARDCSNSSHLSSYSYNIQFIHNWWMKIDKEKQDCGCGVTCTWYKEDDVPPNTKIDLILVMSYEHLKPKQRQFPGQLFAFVKLEPPIHGSFGFDPRLAKRRGYDWKITYERDSDLLLSYAPTNFSFAAYNHTEQRQDNLAVLAISNCKDGDRLAYAAELMKYIPVLSLGKCLNNFPSGQNIATMFPRCHHFSAHKKTVEEKLCIMSHFKFNLAFENSRFDDYVTEKLFEAFNTPSLPIYRGSTTAKELLPAHHSAIFADDFDSPRALAAYVLLLVNNSNLYQEYFRWKQDYLEGAALLPIYQYLQEYNVANFQCNVCRKLHNLKSNVTS